MRKRTKSREFALQILYLLDISKIPLDEALKDFWVEKKELGFTTDELDEQDEEKDETSVTDYSENLVRGIYDKLMYIDPIIEKCADNWALTRMACIDRNILRLGTYEMLYSNEVPMKVAINESVELAKKFGEDDSSKFVNGILDRIAKTECKE